MKYKNKELLKILSSNITEEEKQDLFKKLEKIADKLFGIKISVEKSDFPSYCYYDGENNKICICYYYENNITSLSEKCLDNIDSFDIISKKEMKTSLFVLFLFFHELSHALTMADDDYDNYNKYYSKLVDKYIDNNFEDAYRKFPYEKIADNLAYKLLSENYINIKKFY